MNLHGKHLVRVQKLEQQREAGEARRQLSHQRLWKLLHHLAERLALKRTISNLALVVGAVAQHPCFTDRPIAWKRRREQAGQATAAP